MRLDRCRICENHELREILDLGEMALANEFIDDPDASEARYPLRVLWCDRCGLVQIDEIVPPDDLFSEYVYVSGTSDRLERHFDELASDVIDRYAFSKGDTVTDIGSNDGTLLKCFQERGLEVLGVEPASNVAKIAKNNGIETVNQFFTPSVAYDVHNERGPQDVVTATNVFAHTHDVDAFLEGVSYLIRDDGIFVVEVPYLVDLLEKTEFDTIYHEHLSYFSVRPLKRLFESHGFDILRVDRVDIHGGSIRLIASRSSSIYPKDGSATSLIELERRSKLDTIDPYEAFATKVRTLRSNLLELLERLQAEGNSIAGYGAAAKGNTLLNYYGIGPDTMEFIADNNELKQGKYTPGSNIKVVPSERIYEADINYVLILAWNFTDEIVSQESEFKERGGRFIIPVPDVKVL